MNVLRLQAIVAMAILGAFLILACSENHQRKQEPAVRMIPGEATDRFCNKPVRNREILFKLGNCTDDLDLKNLGDRVTAFLKENTKKDDVIALSRVASGCILLATSENRNVSELMQTFQVFTSQANLESASKNLFKDLEVVDFEPNYLIQLDNETDGLASSPSITGTASQWWFGEPPGSNSAPAWAAFGKGSSSIVVGILDTGLDYGHPELIPNVWVADKKIDLPADDVHCLPGAKGVDVSGLKPTCDPMDEKGHGTHVAGIIGASGRATGVVGVSQSPKILALKVFDSDGNTYVDRVIRAIDIANQLKAKFDVNVRVLNNSYDFDTACADMSLLQGKIQQAADQDILFVAAAGQTPSDAGLDDNDSFTHYPSFFNTLDNVISVTAVGENGDFMKAKGEIANHGKLHVDLGAPGTRIYSTDIVANGRYMSRSGTSMAAPFVSGAAALILSVDGCSFKVSELKNLILSNAAPAAALKDKTVTNGTLDLFSSVSKCAQIP